MLRGPSAEALTQEAIGELAAMADVSATALYEPGAVALEELSHSISLKNLSNAAREIRQSLPSSRSALMRPSRQRGRPFLAPAPKREAP